MSVPYTPIYQLCVCVQEDEEGREGLRLSDGEDNITEQTHHIIVPSYTAWFNYNW